MKTELQPDVALEAVAEGDFEALLALRIEAMRESLERVGRFDLARARERFRAGFAPEFTRYIVCRSDVDGAQDGERVGFVVVKPTAEGLLLDHLYVRPRHQGQRIGSRVLAMVFADADARGLPVRVGALRGSDSNRFYLQHGFVKVEESEWDLYYVRSPAPRRSPE